MMKDQTYSIKDLENFTQIKAHTLRIWELRYGLLKPKRTETNIRYYGEEDLKRILNVNLLYTNGFKISKIARMNDQEMIRQAQILIESSDSRYAKEIDQLLVSILQFDGEGLHGRLQSLLNELGMTELYSAVLLPTLQKIGELWQVNAIEVAHEHFFANLYRDFIVHARQMLPPAHKNAPKALLFLHEHEAHELSLLMNYFLVRERGYHVVYLGQNTPMDTVVNAIQHVEPELIISTFVSKLSTKQMQAIVNNLGTYAAQTRILFSGAQAYIHKKDLPEYITLVQTPNELNALL